jgi:hypothetical protein
MIGALAKQMFSDEPTQTIVDELQRRSATNEAISFAAYRILINLYDGAVQQDKIYKLLDDQMHTLAYDTNIT